MDQFDIAIGIEQVDKFGPLVSLSNTNKLCLKQNSSSRNSIISDNANNDHDESPMQSGRFQAQSVYLMRRKLSSRQINKPSENKQSTEDQNQNFLKTLKVKNIITKFTRNLFLRSYVLQGVNREILTRESYLSNIADQKQSIKQSITCYALPIILPGSHSLIAWDSYGILINLVTLWICPFIAAFEFQGLLSLYLLIICSLFIDIGVNLNRAAILQGEVIKDRSVIFQNYFRGRAIEDLTSLILWIVIANECITQRVVLEIILFIQIIITVRKLYANFENYFDSLYLQGSVGNLLDLITIISAVYYFAHIMACIWHFIGDSTQSLGNTWLIHYDLTSSNQWVKYNYSFYWATMTMVTVGYGDITPQNQVEMVFTNIMMFLSSCMFAYSMNSIGMILKNVQDSKLSFKRSLILINNYMSHNKVEGQIQSRVRNYLKYRNTESELNQNSEELQKVIEDLPNGLKSDLNNNIQIQIMEKMKLISNNFTQNSIKQLANHLEQIKLTPGDILYHQGSINENDLYFLQSGVCESFESKSKFILQKYNAGDCFGEYSFFTNDRPQTSVRSLTFCTIYQIRRSKFLEIISSNSKEFEIFHSIQHELLFQKKCERINLMCNICHSYDHFNINCPLLSYQPDIEQRMKKENYRKQINLRQQYERQGHKINAKIAFNFVRQTITEFIQDVGPSMLESLKLTDQKVSYSQINNQFDRLSDSSLSPNIQILRQRKTINNPTFIRQYKSKGRLETIVQSKVSQFGTQTKVESQKAIKEYCMLDQLKQNLQFHNTDIDKFQQYSEFNPQSNMVLVLQNYQRSLKNKNKQDASFLRSLSLYTFSNQTKCIIEKIRNKLLDQL